MQVKRGRCIYRQIKGDVKFMANELLMFRCVVVIIVRCLELLNGRRFSIHVCNVSSSWRQTLFSLSKALRIQRLLWGQRSCFIFFSVDVAINM